MMFFIVFILATIAFFLVLEGGANAGLIMNYRLLRDFLIYATVIISAYLIEYFNIAGF